MLTWHQSQQTTGTRQFKYEHTHTSLHHFITAFEDMTSEYAHLLFYGMQLTRSDYLKIVDWLRTCVSDSCDYWVQVTDIPGLQLPTCSNLHLIACPLCEENDEHIYAITAGEQTMENVADAQVYVLTQAPTQQQQESLHSLVAHLGLAGHPVLLPMSVHVYCG
jgi:hypothetical protein